MLARESGVAEVAGEALICLRKSRDLLVESRPPGHPRVEMAQTMPFRAQSAVFGSTR